MPTVFGDPLITQMGQDFGHDVDKSHTRRMASLTSLARFSKRRVAIT